MSQLIKSPIDATARATATEAKTKADDIQTGQGSSVVKHTNPDNTAETVSSVLKKLNLKGNKLTVFGDSFTYGVIGETGAYSTENYANYISRATGLPITNKAISGGLLIDLGSNFYNTATSQDDVFLTMTGYNDGRVYGGAANGLLTYRGVLRALLVWLALPDAAKLLANSAGVSYTGTWATLDTVYANKSTSKFTLTPGSSASTVIKGDTIYIGHTRSVSTPAVFRVEIDGRDYGNFTNTAWTASNSGMVYGPDLLRISGLQSSKRHQVTITHISGGEFYLDYISGNGGANVAYPCPAVFSANTVRMLDYSHELSSDAVVDLFNLAHRQVIAELVSDGLNIMHVDTSSGYDPTVHGSANPLEVHPVEVGQQYLKATFLQAMAQDTKAVDKTRRLEKYSAAPGLYLGTTSAEIPVSATTFTFLDFATYTAPLGWVYLPASERSYYPQTPGYVELSAAVTFKGPLLTGRYYVEIYNQDTGEINTLYDELRPAGAESYTMNASIILYANGLGSRFRVRVYSSVATTIAAGQTLTRLQAKFLGA